MKRVDKTILASLLVLVTNTGQSVAHDNKLVHPFLISNNAYAFLDTSTEDQYAALATEFNESLGGANGYDPDDNFLPMLCKPGTRGTILEDTYLILDFGGEGMPGLKPAPFFSHYWLPNEADHRPWWKSLGLGIDGVTYARATFDQGVEAFGEGREERAFVEFGRALHILEDLSSPGHVFGDSHPGFFDENMTTSGNGFEKWVLGTARFQQESFPAASTIEPFASLPEAMERLAVETFRSVRIAGELHPDLLDPATGDLAEMFDNGGVGYVLFVPKDEETGFTEYWIIEGVGKNYTGSEMSRPDAEYGFWGLDYDNDWCRVANLPGEAGEFYYLENHQEAVIPPRVWSPSQSAWVSNPGFTLSRLWAGGSGYRATPAQEQMLIPRATEYAAGYLKYLWDFVNPPPHLARVLITQDQDDNAYISPGEYVYAKSWVPWIDKDGGARNRDLVGRSAVAGHAPVSIALAFSEPVKNVSVWLGTFGPERLIASGASSNRGPPSAADPDGEDLVLLSDVSLAAQPAGQTRLFVAAEDLSNHLGGDASRLDPNPSTRAARRPDGGWSGYVGEGGDTPDLDRNHSFSIATFRLRVAPPGAQVPKGSGVYHAIEVENLSAPAGTEVTIDVQGEAPHWETNASALQGTRFPLPEPGTGWQQVAALNVSNISATSSAIRVAVSGSVAGERQGAVVHDWSNEPPSGDHPDDTYSVAGARYPGPWLVDDASPIGILAGGWGAGLGHLLGRYGIATALVDETLAALREPAPGGRGIRLLLIGSGALEGLGRLPSLRSGLEQFAASGGVIAMFTPKRGAEFEALPGGRVFGYGWTEDQACFGEAVSVVARDPVLAGQEGIRLDVGADGYLSRWPDDADILLRRNSNGQPALIRYPFGRGSVYVAALYPDWSYGSNQSSEAERRLVRDLVTVALEHPASVPLHLAGETVVLAPTIVNNSLRSSVTALIKVLTPDRRIHTAHNYPLALAPGAFTTLPLTVVAPAGLGVYTLACTIFDGDSVALQEPAGAGSFAVHRGLALPDQEAAGYRIWVTTASDQVVHPGPVTGTVHVRNDTAQEFRGYLAATWRHLGSGALVTVPEVVVPPNGEGSWALDYPVPRSDFTILYALYAGDPPAPAEFPAGNVATAERGFTVLFPELALEIAADPGAFRAGSLVPVTVRIRNDLPRPLNADLSLSLGGGENRELWSGARAVTIAAEGFREESFSVELPVDARGPSLLRVEARSGGLLCAQAAASFLIADPQLLVSLRRPEPWPSGGEAALTLTVANVGQLRRDDVTVAAALAGPAGESVWEAAAPLPPLAPGESVEIALPATLPPLRFGAHTLSWEARYEGGRTTASRRLTNRFDLEIHLLDRELAAGDRLSGAVVLRNSGDFTGPLQVTLAAPGLGFAEESVAVPVAGLQLPLEVPVPQDVAPGRSDVTVTIRAAEEQLVSVPIFVPPGWLEILPPGDEAEAGGTAEIAVLNAGAARLTFDWELRLLSCAVDPEDPTAPALAAAAGGRTLGRGDDATFGLTVPADLPEGVYALIFSAYDPESGRHWDKSWYLHVSGVAAALEVGTDQPRYAVEEAVAASVRIGNGARPLAGALLRLEVSGSATLAPVPFTGTVHVAPDGDDLAGDGSREHPLGTVQAAVDRAAAGERVLLLPGSHAAGEVRLREGSILQGELVDGEPSARLEGADIIGTSGAIVDRLRLVDSQVLFPEAVTDIRVSECLIEELQRGAASGGGVVFFAAASDVLIARNRFLRLQRSRAGLWFLGSAAGVIVAGNEFADFAAGRLGGIHFSGAAGDIVVEGNSVHDIPGDTSGLHFWGGNGSSSLRGLQVVSNRFARLPGGAGGVLLWADAQAFEIRGNEFEDLGGSLSGIHVLAASRSAVISDNTLRRFRGDTPGIHCWGSSTGPDAGVTIGHNLLEDLGAAAFGDSLAGIHVWRAARNLAIEGNLLRRVTDAAPEALESGILLWEAGEEVLIARNVVASGAAGIVLRTAGLADPFGVPGPVVAHNLLVDIGVGFGEWTTVGGGAAVLRDNVIAGSHWAGVYYRSNAGIPASSAVVNNLFHDNAADFAGRADLLGTAGNLAADPLLADAASGDYRLLSGSPGADAATDAPLDIGPLDDARGFLPGPRLVPPLALAEVHWREEVPVDLAAGEELATSLPVSPLDAQGQLQLRGEILDAAGRVIATAHHGFWRGDDPIAVVLATGRPAYRPGERIAVAGTVANEGPDPVARLAVRVASGPELLFEREFDLGPGESSPFAFEVVLERSVVLEATAATATAALPITIASPAAALELHAPATAGDEPFAVEAVASNLGVVPVDFTLDLDGEDFAGALEPAERREFAVMRAIDADRVFVAALAGDVREVASAVVRYGVSPRVGLRVAPVSPAGPVAAIVEVANDGTVGARVVARVVLAGPGDAERGAWSPAFWVDPGATVEERLPLGDLAPGSYRLSASVGAAFAEATFEVRPALLGVIMGIDVTGVTVSPAGLTAEIEVANQGVEVFAGSLELEGPMGMLTAEVSLPSGEARRVPFAGSLALAAPGVHQLTARLATEGVVVDSRSVPLALFPRLALAPLPAELPIETGGVATITVGVVNAGPVRGAFSLRLVAGDLADATQVATVEAGGAAAIAFGFPVPEDLPELSAPARILLTDLISGAVEERGVTLYTVNAPAVFLASSFDRPAYRDYDTARFVLWIGTPAAAAIPLRVLVSHGDYRAWSDVVVGPAPSGTLMVHGEPAVPRLFPGQAEGEYVSSVLEAGNSLGAALSWVADASPDCTATAAVRTGSAPNPDATWSPWISAVNGEPSVERADRFLQYRLALACPGPDPRAALLEMTIDAPAGGKRFRHATFQDFVSMPAVVSSEFAVDFSSGDRVFFGAYAASGRSLALDVATIRRLGETLSLRADRDRYLAGDEVRLLAEVGEPGTLLLDGPGWQETAVFAGAGTREITFALPSQIVSGTYFVTATLGAAVATVPIEVIGYSVHVMEAQLDRDSYLPGETATLTLRLFSEDDLPGASLEAWLAADGSFLAVPAVAADLVYGPNLITIVVPVALAQPGPARCEFLLTLPQPEGPSLPLTAGHVAFDLLAPNRAPSADAGSDLVAAEREWVALDGRGSRDPDGDRLRYSWAQSGGAAVLLHGAGSALPVFLAPEVGPGGAALAFALVVSDGREESPPSSVAVRVENRNRPPVAVAGPDATRAVGEEASLDGSLSHDPDGEPLAFRWEIARRPAGSGAVLDDTGSVQPRFAIDRAGEYDVALVVSDGTDESAPDNVRVSTVNSAPTADAGPDRTAPRGETVTLDGGASADPDDDPILGWRWRLLETPAGSSARLAGADTPTPSFVVDPCGDYVAELVVDDGALASEPDTVRIGCENAAPIADAGPDRAARIGETVVLDGTASSDPDGDPLAWAWSLLQAPAGSVAALADPASPGPSFVPDVVGAYAFSLVVNDALLASAPDGVVIDAGTNIAAATVNLKPAKVRRAALPTSIRAWIELPAGWSAASIDPAQAAITAVRAKTLARPVRRLATKPALLVDRDADGLPELQLDFPVKPLRKLLRPGGNLLTIRGPLGSGGGFLGAATLKVR